MSKVRPLPPIACGLAAVALCAVIVRNPPDLRAADQIAPAQPSFAGKAVAVLTKDSPDHPRHYLGQPEIKVFGGHAFLVGTQLQRLTGGVRARTWVRLDGVSELMEYDSVEDLKKNWKLDDVRDLKKN